MTENFSHSSVCLRVYLESGRKALAHLRQGLIDDAIGALRKRTASFGNLKVAEFKLEKSGRCLADDRELQELWQAIAKDDRALATALREALTGLSSELGRLKAAKKNLASFKSSQRAPAQFTKHI